MSRIHTVQTNFSSGEIDPDMRVRVDTGAYQNGARTLTNVRILNTGGVERRPGTWAVAPLPGLCRLEKFVFDQDEVYIFAFRSGHCTIYDADGVEIDDVAGNWTADEVWELTFAQLADTMFVFHPDNKPRVITRTSLTTFTSSYIDFENSLDNTKTYQPYYKFAAETIALKSSALSGAGATITASAAVFTADHVGCRLRIYGVEVNITGFTNSTHVTGNLTGKIRALLEPDPYKVTKGSTSVICTHVAHGLADGDTITLAGSNDTGGIASADLNGARVVNVIDENSYSFTAGGSATSSVDGGGPSVSFNAVNLWTRAWDEAAYSNARGWPAAGCFHGNRFWLGGGYELPAALFGSKVGRYLNFDLGSAGETDGIGVIIGQDRVVSIRHICSSKHLQIFTDAAEYYIPNPQEQPTTPLNIRAEKATPYGISSINPYVFDGATIFVQRSKKAVREFIYSDQERQYAANPLSLAATHLLTGPRDLAVVYGTEDRPEQYAIIVNEDGTLAVLHSQRVERLAGWVRWTTLSEDGTTNGFQSVTVIDGTIWACVHRRGAYWLERFDTSGTLTLDGAVSLSAASTKVWSVGLWGTAGTASVVSRREDDDDSQVCYSFGSLTVAASAVTLPAAVDNIIIGDDYGIEIETLPPAIQTDAGTLLGDKKRIVKAKVAVSDTMQLVVGGDEMILRATTDDLSLPPTALTGYYEFTQLGYLEEPTITFTQDDALPMRLMGVVMKVSV